MMAVPVLPSSATVDVCVARLPPLSRYVRVAAAVTVKGWQRMVRLVGCQPCRPGRCINGSVEIRVAVVWWFGCVRNDCGNVF